MHGMNIKINGINMFVWEVCLQDVSDHGAYRGAMSHYLCWLWLWVYGLGTTESTRISVDY
jgi:hypothetical protein